MFMRGFSGLCAVQQHRTMSNKPVPCWQLTADAPLFQPDAAGCLHQPTGSKPQVCCLMLTSVSSLLQVWRQLPGQHMWQQPTRDAI